jgi:hypothetical protein
VQSEPHAPAFLKRLPWVVLALAVFGLVFRSFIWASWTPYPGEPLSFADVIEFVVGLAFLGACALCALAGLAVLIVARWRSPRTGAGLLAVGLLAPVVYYLAYRQVPIFQLW